MVAEVQINYFPIPLHHSFYLNIFKHVKRGKNILFDFKAFNVKNFTLTFVNFLSFSYLNKSCLFFKTRQSWLYFDFRSFIFLKSVNEAFLISLLIFFFETFPVKRFKKLIKFFMIKVGQAYLPSVLLNSIRRFHLIVLHIIILNGTLIGENFFRKFFRQPLNALQSLYSKLMFEGTNWRRRFISEFQSHLIFFNIFKISVNIWH